VSEPIRTMQEFRARYLPNCKEPWPEDPEQAAQRIVDNAMRAFRAALDGPDTLEVKDDAKPAH
jgi:hypothetical protein